MKQILSLAFFLTIISIYSFGQKDTKSVYGKLKTIKDYSVSLNSYESDSGIMIYEVNDKQVSRRMYRRYEKHTENYLTDNLRIVKSYDENNVLLYEAVQYSDCIVGYYKEYYPNGKLSVLAHYKENPTGNWDSIWNRGYCSVAHGQWIYYAEDGSIQYSEFWENDNFIKQLPEQKTTQIWKVEILLNGEPVGQREILPSQLKDLVIAPKFKNSNRDSINLKIAFQVSAIGRKYIDQTFTLDSFKLFDLKNLLLEKGFKAQDKIVYSLRVLNNQRYISYTPLNILVDLPPSTDTIIEKPIDSTMIIANNTNFYLVNSLDSTKRIKLQGYYTYRLNASMESADSLTSEIHSTFNGKLMSVDTISIRISLSYESISTEYKDGSTMNLQRDYSYLKYNNTENFKKVDLKNIKYISYTSPTRYFFESIGGPTVSISVLTTLFIAPLVSINYKNGDFNKARYYKVAGIGLVGVAVSIPLLAFSNPKDYKLISKNNIPGKTLWYLDSKIRQ